MYLRKITHQAALGKRNDQLALTKPYTRMPVFFTEATNLVCSCLTEREIGAVFFAVYSSAQ